MGTHMSERWSIIFTIGGIQSKPAYVFDGGMPALKTATMVTGAVLPAFNHPLQLASHIAMLDGLSNGRLEVGFARAFLPQEFRHLMWILTRVLTGLKRASSRCKRLLEEENVTCDGRFHSFSDVTTHPGQLNLPGLLFMSPLWGPRVLRASG